MTTRLVDPRLPSVREVKDHKLAGPECTCGQKEKDLDHRADPLKERSVPEYSFESRIPK